MFYLTQIIAFHCCYENDGKWLQISHDALLVKQTKMMNAGMLESGQVCTEKLFILTNSAAKKIISAT